MLNAWGASSVLHMFCSTLWVASLEPSPLSHLVLQTLASYALQTLSPLYNSESWPGSIFTASWSGISLKAVNQGSCKTHLVYYFPLFPNAQYLGNCCLIYFVGFFFCCCCCFRQEGKSGPWTMPWPEAEVLWIQVCYHFWWRQDPDMPSLTINMGEKNKI